MSGTGRSPARRDEADKIHLRAMHNEYADWIFRRSIADATDAAAAVAASALSAGCKGSGRAVSPANTDPCERLGHGQELLAMPGTDTAPARVPTNRSGTRRRNRIRAGSHARAAINPAVKKTRTADAYTRPGTADPGGNRSQGKETRGKDVSRRVATSKARSRARSSFGAAPDVDPDRGRLPDPRTDRDPSWQGDDRDKCSSPGRWSTRDRVRRLCRA